MPIVDDFGGLAWEKDTKRGGIAFLLRRHHQPFRVMAAAGEWHLPSDPPAPIDRYCLGGRMERASDRRYTTGEQLLYTFERQPSRVGGDRLVHHKVPRSS